MKVFKEIPLEVIKPLEEAFYNHESYKAVIPQFLKLPKEKIDYTLIEVIREEYKKALITYETEKINFEIDFVKKEYPEALSWSVTFGNRQVEITLPEN